MFFSLFMSRTWWRNHLLHSSWVGAPREQADVQGWAETYRESIAVSTFRQGVDKTSMRRQQGGSGSLVTP